MKKYEKYTSQFDNGKIDTQANRYIFIDRANPYASAKAKNLQKATKKKPIEFIKIKKEGIYK